MKESKSVTHPTTLPFTWGLRIDGTADIQRSAQKDADDEQGYDVFASTTAGPRPR